MKVSVALCSYNGEKYIREQLESILRQTRLPDEIIVCDDRSKDKTAEIAREVLGASGVPYQVIVNEKNLGCGRNFEQCSMLCSGDIVFFADQDDVWLETKIEKMEAAFAADPECVLCFCDAKVTDAELNVVDASLNKDCISAENFLSRALDNAYPYGCTMAVKRDFVAQNIPFPFLHDGYLSMCAEFFGTVQAVKEPLILYRRHETATSGYRDSNSFKRRLRSIFNIFSQLKRSRESYFGWPTAFLAGYGDFYQRFQEPLQRKAPEAASLLNNRIQFCTELQAVVSAPKFKAIKLLRSTWKSGLYGKIRGNQNMLRWDMLYLLLKWGNK